MSEKEPKHKIRLDLSDPKMRRTWETIQITKREVEQWPSWKRVGDEGTPQAFRDRWQAFMEGGWERIVAEEPTAVEAARCFAAETIPQHPESIGVGELVARAVDIGNLCTQEQLFAALLLMERHGHVVLVVGHAYRPPPRVPRRGHQLEDMHYLFGYAPAREK